MDTTSYRKLVAETTWRTGYRSEKIPLYSYTDTIRGHKALVTRYKAMYTPPPKVRVWEHSLDTYAELDTRPEGPDDVY